MFEFHRQLLADEVRTTLFRQAIARVVKEDDIVLDIGTGTGVLAFFACQAGARHVYAIEVQHSADAALMLARRFGYAERLTVFHARSNDVELPEPATVLITETLGSLGFNEGFLSTVADARARLLAPGARLIPSRVDLWAAPAELPEFYERQIDWWRTPRYGFDFSPLRLFASNAAYSTEIVPDALLAPPAPVVSVDAASFEGTAHGGSVVFRTQRGGVLHGFAIGFTATLAPEVTVTNAWSGADSWERGVLPLDEPVKVGLGTEIELELATGNGRSWRWSGVIGSSHRVAFDQTTILSRPPCSLTRQPL
jgi:protein arginine N-methyltransferase 1